MKGYVVCGVVAAMLIASAAGMCQLPKFSAVVEGKGKNTRRLSFSVDYFNELLGGDNNGGDAGPLPSGRRSINWDAAAVPFRMPGNFFETTVTRGLKITNSNNKFRVSNPAGAPADDKFSTINARASQEFTTFSPLRLFSPLNDNVITITFSVPVQGDKAVVKGFGAVYVDVDKPNITKAVYYDKNGCVLKEEFVQPQNRGMSFLGVVFDRPIIAKVELTLGARPIGLPWNGRDMVVLDDFLYGEPKAI